MAYFAQFDVHTLPYDMDVINSGLDTPYYCQKALQGLLVVICSSLNCASLYIIRLKSDVLSFFV